MSDIAALDPIFVLSNRLEALLWSAIGMSFLVVALRRNNSHRSEMLLAAVTFFAFGISDIVESRTGAWWRPFWLLLWKGMCLLVFAVLLARYVYRQRKRKS